jgi:hypothetical protein
VDIEATIRDGRLDVGVFAPVEMLGVQGAEDLIGNWKKGLEGVVEEGVIVLIWSFRNWCLAWLLGFLSAGRLD